MRFIGIPLRNLRRRPARTAFAAIGIALATATFLAMTVLFGGLAERWRAGLAGAGIDAIVVQGRQIDWLASAVPQGVAAELGRVPGLVAEPELMVFLTGPRGESILASGWAPGSRLHATLRLVAGGPAAPDPADPAVPALIGAPLAEALGLGPGARLELDGLAVRIEGLFLADDALMGNRLILPLDALQAHMFRHGSVTFVHLLSADPARAAPIEAARVRLAEWPGLALRETAAFVQDNRMVALLEALSAVAVWMVALASAAGTANIMLMAAHERRAEVGLLLALGWAPGRIVALFLIEALMISAVAGAAGVALGLGVIALVKHGAALAILLSGPVAPLALAQAFGLAVLIGTLAGIAPAARVLRMPPDAALRGT